jgi:hypothetical protein
MATIDSQIRKLHARGLNDQQIADALGAPKTSIWYRRKRLGLPSHIQRAAMPKAKPKLPPLCKRCAHLYCEPGHVWCEDCEEMASRVSRRVNAGRTAESESRAEQVGRAVSL